MSVKYRMTPLEPLLCRDARPCGFGSKMRSQNWISQSTLAGTVRTTLWKRHAQPDSDPNLPSTLKRVIVEGPFPVANGSLFLPLPFDVVVANIGGSEKIFQVKPFTIPEGCGLPMPLSGLLPCALDTDESFKPETVNSFWSLKQLTKWLASPDARQFHFDKNETLASPVREERTHVTIDENTGTAQDAMLFQTSVLNFMRKTGSKGEEKFSAGSLSLSVTLDGTGETLPDRFTAPVGGDRHLAVFERCDSDKALWLCPSELRLTLHAGDKFRMLLATPAVFTPGWYPGWISPETREGTIPGTSAKVRLVSAVTRRWQPLSGWSYEKGRTGPKAMRRMVPAGSLYSMEVIGGSFDIASVWLRSVCDAEQDRRDGLGLALWGRASW